MRLPMHDHSRAARNSRRWRVSRFADYAALFIIAFLVTLFSLWMPDIFPTVSNLQSLFIQQVVTGLLALGLLVPMISGEFDFSGGAVVSASAVVTALLMSGGALPWWAVVALVVVGGGVVGAGNGVLVAVLGFNSLVATLATAGVLSGSALMLSDGMTLYEGIPQEFLSWGQRHVFGVPISVLYFLIVFIMLTFVLTQTPWGRAHAAVGKGRLAAELAGVSVRRHLFTGFVISGVVAGIAGVLLVAQLGSAPADVGQAYILSAFAAVFLGSTIFRPGSFNPSGTLAAIILIAVGINGLSLAGVSAFVSQVFTGVLLLASVGLSQVRLGTTQTSRETSHEADSAPDGSSLSST